MLNPANVDQIIFGFKGGKFYSEGLTVEVTDLLTTDGALDRVEYDVRVDQSSMGKLMDTIDNLLIEYKPMRVLASVEAGGLRIQAVVEKPADTANSEPDGPKTVDYVLDGESALGRAASICGVTRMSTAYAGALFSEILNHRLPITGAEALEAAAARIERGSTKMVDHRR